MAAGGEGHGWILDLSRRTGPLRVGRAFARLFKASRGPPVGRDCLHSNQRRTCRFIQIRRRYTRHEVAAPRVVGQSGRTGFAGC